MHALTPRSLGSGPRASGSPGLGPRHHSGTRTVQEGGGVWFPESLGPWGPLIPAPCHFTGALIELVASSVETGGADDRLLTLPGPSAHTPDQHGSQGPPADPAQAPPSLLGTEGGFGGA